MIATIASSNWERKKIADEYAKNKLNYL